jgi:hypothetical protein
MNPLIAGKIGRPDLLGVPIDTYGGTSGIFQGAASGAVGSQGLSLGAGAEAGGRLTAGVLIVVLGVVAGFYIWTRGVQA